MSATYLAWNGQSYPWPPPDGWYEAADGRWWASGSGPDLASPGVDAGDTASDSTAYAQSDTSTLDSPLTGLPSAVGDLPSAIRLNDPEDQNTILTHRTTEVIGRPSDMGRPALDLGPVTPGEGPPEAGLWQPAHPKRAGRSTSPIVVGAGLAIGLVVAGLAVFTLAGGDDGAADGQPTSTSASADTATGPAEGSVSDTRTGDITGSIQTEQTDQTDTTGTTPPNASTTETSGTIASEAAGLDTSAVQEKVAEFRAFLELNGLSGELLKDEDVVEFGNSFCVFAVAANDLDEYVGYREEAIARSESELTDDELVIAVDGAVATFCPEDARRLGVGQ